MLTALLPFRLNSFVLSWAIPPPQDNGDFSFAIRIVVPFQPALTENCDAWTVVTNV
jgi:hypothetical protein